MLFVTLTFALTMFMASCSSNSSNKAQKKGPAIAQAISDQKGEVIFVDVNGKRLIDDTSFSSVGVFSEGLCAVVDEESGLVGFINVKGKTVIPCQFKDETYHGRISGTAIRTSEMFHNGYARVGLNDNSLLIDRKGKQVLKGYTALDWDGKVAIVCKDDIYEPGLVTMSGKELVAMGTYIKMEFIGEGMLKVTGKNGDKGIIDYNGKALIDSEQGAEISNMPYSKVGEFVNGYVVVQTKSGEWRAMDKQGHVITTLPKYSGNTPTFSGQMPSFKEGYIIFDGSVYKSNLGIVANFPPEGTRMNGWLFIDGMASVYEGTTSDAKLGFANTDGELTVPCLYEKKTDFSEGLAFVKDDEGWHIIDKKGNITGTLQLQGISTYDLGKFCAGRAVIKNEVVVDKTGKIIDMPGIVEISDYYYSGNDNSQLKDEM